MSAPALVGGFQVVVSMRVLLVEDDQEVAAYVAGGLQSEGFDVSISRDGREGLNRAIADNWDIIIVDRKLPSVDGLTLVKMLRTADTKVPVLFLTTMMGVGDRIEGLNAGADDYVVKPFAFGELVARLNAISRRGRQATPETRMSLGDIEIDLLRRSVLRGGQVVELQPREFRLLAFLMQNANEVVTRTMLLENVWDFYFTPQTNVVETHVSRLKSKLNESGAPNLIQTVRGIGYMIKAV